MALDPNELAKKLQQGEQEVVSSLINHYQLPIYKVALAITHSEQDAEDIVQETLLQMIKKIDTWRGENFSAWIMRIAKNLAIDWLRKRRKAIVSKESYAIPKDHLITKERQQLVNRVLQKLPEKQRNVIYLRHFKDFSIKEIAKHQNCAEGTVKATLFQTFVKLKKDFQQIGLME